MEVQTTNWITLLNNIHTQANTTRELYEASLFEVRKNGRSQPVIAIDIGDDFFALGVSFDFARVIDCIVKIDEQIAIADFDQNCIFGQVSSDFHTVCIFKVTASVFF